MLGRLRLASEAAADRDLAAHHLLVQQPEEMRRLDRSLLNLLFLLHGTRARRVGACGGSASLSAATPSSVEQVHLHGEADQFGPALELVAAQHHVDMELHRMWADVEPLADGVVVLAVRNASDDVELPLVSDLVCRTIQANSLENMR